MTRTASGSFVAIDAAISEYSSHVDRVRQDLYYCDVSFAARRTRDLRTNIHAASYVYVAAALERYVSSALQAVVDEINATSTMFSSLRPSLFAIAECSSLASLQDVRGLKMWGRRAQIFAHIDSTATCLIDSAFIPLDGRTIRPEHFETIWQVFGFSGTTLPGPFHRLALMSLANSRNDVAHGQEHPAVVAGRLSITDTLLVFERVGQVAEHLWAVATDYLQGAAYLR